MTKRNACDGNKQADLYQEKSCHFFGTIIQNLLVKKVIVIKVVCQFDLEEVFGEGVAPTYSCRLAYLLKWREEIFAMCFLSCLMS